ncbi:MAG: hypothetical protein ABSH36_00645 [Solirubrobacteraceae bacterium]
MNPTDNKSLTPPTPPPSVSAQPTANGHLEEAGLPRSAILSARPSRAILERIAQHRDAGAILILAILAVIVCGPHVLNGGLMIDDWTFVAEAHFTDFGKLLNYLVSHDVRRPVGGFYLAALYVLLGSHVKLMLAFSAAMRFLLVAILYGLLRELRFSWLAAVAIAGLTLLFPTADSTWLWIGASELSFAVACVLLGCLLNLRAMKNGESPRLPLRVIGLALIATGILSYELVIPIGLASGALYLTRARPRQVLREWGIDVLVLGIVIIVFTFHTVPLVQGTDDHELSSYALMGEHAHVIFSQSATLLTHSLLPYGTPRNVTVLGMLATILMLAVVVSYMLKPSDEARRALRRWLIVTAAGVLFIGLGYVFLVPANIYYRPLQVGVGNRTNDITAIGYALIVYSSAALVGTLVFRELRSSRLLVGTLTALITVVIGAGYVRQIDTDEAAWHQSTVLQHMILTTLRTHIAPPPRGTSVITLDAPTETAPGVTVFSVSWDLNSAVQLLWNDPTLKAYPMAPGLQITCKPTQLLVGAPGSPPSWQTTYPTDFMDVAAGTVFSVKRAPACIDASTKLGVLAT